MSACHREGVDSLFDASMFDAAPTPPPPAKVGVGQIDIFGNVVEVAADLVESRTDGPEEADDLGVADPAEPFDEIDVGESEVGEPDPSAEAFDPGDTLNDPSWEPPIDDSLIDDSPIDDSPADDSLIDDSPAEDSPTDDVPADDSPTDDSPVDYMPVERGPSVDELWTAVVGQPEALGLLRGAALAPVHAYLFVGPPGSGRRNAARAFAAALLCPRGGCGRCDVCSRSIAALHPDLVEVEREGASISVDQAREIVRLAMRSPLEGARKVVVLVDFHLVANAAPTLLKIVEEPPPSTVFVVLADQLTQELVTIASRCVEVRFRALTLEAVVSQLQVEGVDEARARQVAAAAGGRLDRARLLVHDEQLQTRIRFWEQIPRRLDGTGAAVAVIAAEALTLIDGAAMKPLESRHGAELKVLEERIETTGMRGAAGIRKDLQERQKRELKRLRDDELRLGLGVLQQQYRAALVVGSDAHGRAHVAALQTLGEAGIDLVRNPNLSLLLASVFLKLEPLPGYSA